MSGEITPGSNLNLALISQLLAMGSSKAITIPTVYRDQVLVVKQLLKNDVSGLANSIIDFCISSALVDYKVEANGGAKDLLNDWLEGINSSLVGNIPIGIQALAKQYFRERWAGSSNLVLVTKWETKDDYKLPSIMYLIDGEDVVISSNETYTEIGKQKYAIRVGTDPSKNIKLPQKDDKIFVQKPYESWSTTYPTPFLIKRGIYQNIKMLSLITHKGEVVVDKALEYLLLMKKGDKELAKLNRPEFVYDKDDLTKAKDGLKKVVDDSKQENGTPTWATNFDTDLSHVIPDYKNIISKELYSPFEKNILVGLGMIEVIEGTSSSRQQSILNPKPLISEIYSGINDFKALIENIIYTIKQENKSAHRKFASTKTFLKASLVQAFATMDDKTILRGIYDRGGLSKETYVELSGDVNFEVEVSKRKEERKNGTDKTCYPPITVNNEKDPDIIPDNKNTNEPVIDPDAPTDENENQDKTGLEKKNFTQSKEEFECKNCRHIFDFDSQPEIAVGKVECPECGNEVIFEQAPYTKDNYPDAIKNLPVGARSIWIKSFNAILEDTGDEDAARQGAWSNVKKKYKKNKDGKWVKIKE